MDTLSYERMTPDGSIVFGWMFRPVLGRRSVTPGFKQLFAVFALPRTDCIDPAKDDACVTVFPIPHFYRQHDLLWVWKHLPAAERRNASAAFGSMVMKKDAPKCDDASIEAD